MPVSEKQVVRAAQAILRLAGKGDERPSVPEWDQACDHARVILEAADIPEEPEDGR